MLDLRATSLYQSRLATPLKPVLRRLRRSQIGQNLATSLWFPLNWRSTLMLCRILALDYGHLRTVATGRPADPDGRPLPWYTYPAIEFLRQLDFRQASVFEYGSGNSTLFWSSVARNVVSVEDEESWHAELAPRIPANCRLLGEPDLDRFVARIDEFDTFDVIIVDGPARGRTRLKCARAAVRHLRKGGMIILDNADWLPQSAAFLRGSGLLQVDMTGFSPINSFTGTTSFFFDRSWELVPKGERCPAPGVGACSYDWETSRDLVGKRIQCGEEFLAGIALEDSLQLDVDGEARTFRIVSHELATGAMAIAVVDDHRGRIVLANHAPHAGSWSKVRHSVEAEVRRIRAMSASEFRNFINGHPARRYKL